MLKNFTDELGRQISLPFPPQRIVSLVPSLTELLFDLGCGDRVVGVTNFCVHPAQELTSIPKIGGTKDPDIEAIRALQPDLILANKEENIQEHVALLAQHTAVYVCDINSLDEAQQSLLNIGALLDRQPEAQYMHHLIQVGFRDLKALALQQHFHNKMLYLIWKSPYMLAGKDTFISDVLHYVGLENAAEGLRYPTYTIEEMQNLNPDFVLLSTEPYPFSEKHVLRLQQQFPHKRVILLDGEMCSWYGSRLIKAVQYFFELQQLLFKKN